MKYFWINDKLQMPKFADHSYYTYDFLKARVKLEGFYIEQRKMCSQERASLMRNQAWATTGSKIIEPGKKVELWVGKGEGRGKNHKSEQLLLIQNKTKSYEGKI